jgi:hypothetical protein
VGVTFYDTVRTADTTNLSTFRKASVVIAFSATIAAIVILSIFNPLGAVLEMKNASKVGIKTRATAMSVAGDDGALHRSGAQQQQHKQPSAEQATESSANSSKKFLAAYIDSVLPAVFRVNSGVSALLHEIYRHHRYLIMLSTSSNILHRARLMLHLYCSWLFMFFIMALVFDLEVGSQAASIHVIYVFSVSLIVCLTFLFSFPVTMEPVLCS